MQKLPLCFSILKTSYLARKQFAIVPATTILSQILKILVTNGIILSVDLVGPYYKVYFNYNFPFKSIIYVPVLKKQTWMPAKVIRKLNFAFAIFSTSKGLLTLVEAQKLNVGGILICKCEFNTL